MPVQKCQKDNKPGFKWGNEGKCYTYTPGDRDALERAKANAAKQGRAIEADSGS